MWGPRGGPGEFTRRRARVEQLLPDATPAVRAPLTLLAAVLDHQSSEAERSTVDGVADGAAGRLASGRLPLLDLSAAASAVEDRLEAAFVALEAVVPAPLDNAGAQLREFASSERAALVETWLDDPALVEPRLGFWVRVAAGPILERAARAVAAPADWKGAACPMCGGPPQASVIAEETGEFMAGAPRSLVCGRCAAWWPFARITCPYCGEEDPRRIDGFLADDHRWVRIDTCETCSGYVKTFDLREKGTADVVPLVDDVATLTLDVWAQDKGLARPTPSVAGV